MSGPFVNYELRSHAGGAIAAKLNSTMANDALAFTVQAGQGATYPDGSAGPFHMSLDAGASGMEHVRVSSRSGDTFTLNSIADRGLMGTTAVQHAQGAAVTHGWSATESNEVVKAAHYTLGQVTARGQMLYSDTATTLAVVAAGTAGKAPTVQTDGSIAMDTPIPKAHIHPTSDVTGLDAALAATNAAVAAISTAPLAITNYFTSVNTPTSSFAAVDATHLSVTFTAPASGKVLLRFSTFAQNNSSTATLLMGWTVHGGSTVVTGNSIAVANAATVPASMPLYVTGLTPGTSYHYDLASLASGGTAYALQYTTLEVWSA